VFKVKF